MEYSETRIQRSLKAASLSASVRFALANAEQLLGLCEAVGAGDSREGLDLARSALDRLWAASEQPAPDLDFLSQLGEQVEDSILHEDDFSDYTDSLLQNLMTAVAYSIRLFTTGSARNGVWAARQLFEAADVVVQTHAPPNEYLDEDQPVMDLVIDRINEWLEAVEANGDVPRPDVLRAQGRELAQFIAGYS